MANAAVTQNMNVKRPPGSSVQRSGVLFGLWSGWPDADALSFGLAAAGLKHSVHGDFNLFSAAEVRAAMDPGSFDIRR